MQVSTNGIIILEKDISENDKLVTILTKDWGIIRAFAKGAKKLKNKNFSALSLFSYSDLVLYKGRDKYIINDAYLKKSFFELRKNIENPLDKFSSLEYTDVRKSKTAEQE